MLFRRLSVLFERRLCSGISIIFVNGTEKVFKVIIIADVFDHLSQKIFSGFLTIRISSTHCWFGVVVAFFFALSGFVDRSLCNSVS